MDEKLLGGLSPRRFLKRHWQKRPKLIRGAIPGFRDPLRPRDLAALACRADVESRLVLRRGGDRPFQVIDGPQDPRRLRRLPPTHWTLLVQGVERHVPALADLQERFSFLPRWRLDDVMASWARPSGTVGPHIDNYDVFLLQGQGRRRWQISTTAREDFRPGLDLSVLRRFRAEEEWVLEAGDMLYVPPGVAHYGVALDDCLTYSIGFRAPGERELLAALGRRLVEEADERARYRDPGLQPTRHPGEIAAAARRQLAGMISRACEASVAASDRFLGELLTEPKQERVIAGGRRRATSTIERDVARADVVLTRSPASRVAFVSLATGGALLFADGRTFPLTPPMAFAAPLLCNSRTVPAAALGGRYRRGLAALLTALVNDGVFDVVRPPAGGVRRAPVGSRRRTARR